MWASCSMFDVRFRLVRAHPDTATSLEIVRWGACLRPGVSSLGLCKGAVPEAGAPVAVSRSAPLVPPPPVGTIPGCKPGSHQPRRFGEAAEYVEALHRLAAGALNDVVLGAQDNEAAGPVIQAPRDFDDVCADDILGVGERLALEQADKRLVAESGLVAGVDFFRERFQSRPGLARIGRGNAWPAA